MKSEIDFIWFSSKLTKFMQNAFVLALGGVGGAVSTFVLHKYGFSVVVASCVVGLVGAFIGHIFNSKELSFVIFAGSFVGMTRNSLSTLPLMIIGGAITGIIYRYTHHIFTGVGGRLGTIAFISGLISLNLLSLIKKAATVLNSGKN